ncbi:coiled-coil domain-containing protein 14 [Gastrophryne carolinensis]
MRFVQDQRCITLIERTQVDDYSLGGGGAWDMRRSLINDERTAAASLGRFSVPVRPLSCKKRAAVRKISITSADSGYSLCSTDSEDQVLVLHEGLDRCAALLQDILQSDVRENPMKSQRATFPAANHVKPSAKAKKSFARKPAAASHVLREKGFVRKSAPPAACVARAPSQAPPTMSSDHVQTQMQLLNRATSHYYGASRVGASCPVVTRLPPSAGPESAVLFNCRLPTSTPTLSPQHPSNCQDAGYGVQCQSLPHGGAAHFPFPGAPSSAAAPVPPAMCAAQAPGHPVHAPSQPDLCKTPLDPELLQHVAAHLAQLQHAETSGWRGEALLEPERPAPAAETDETSSDEDETFTAARDIGCQTSPEKAERKIQTVKYLLGEIKALVSDQDDGEALRLISELERSVSLLHAPAGANANVHAEIALALQPLRSENAQLRRRLRILNQQLRDCERNTRSDEHQREVAALQAMNATLQEELADSQSSGESLRLTNQELREENQKLSQIIQEKEQRHAAASAALKTEAEDAAGKMRSAQLKLESAEKENQILGITLRQRDAEVGRLRELTRTLQSGMAKLLCDLGKDAARSSPATALTQAALTSHQKQLSGDAYPAGASIISYLNRLEAGVAHCDSAATSDPGDSEGNYGMAESASASAPPPLGLLAGARSQSCSVLGDEFHPEETTYLPLTSSPHRGGASAPAREMCTPPKICANEPGAGNRPPRTCTAASDQPRGDHDAPASRSFPPPLLQHLRHLRPAGPESCDWSVASFSTFTSRDERDFRSGLAALDANIAKLQRTLQSSARK